MVRYSQAAASGNVRRVVSNCISSHCPVKKDDEDIEVIDLDENREDIKPTTWH